MEKIHQKWKPIEDLPDGWRTLADPELPSLGRVWADLRVTLEQEGGLKTFMERLSRELAIETGVIERLYTLDRGITTLLIEKGIDAAYIPHGATDRSPELVAALIKDQKDAVDGLFAFVREERTLSTSYVKELHAALTRHQDTTEAVDPAGKHFDVPLLKGSWKTRPNNPQRPDGEIHEYCPHEHVASEMDRLIALHEQHIKEDVPPEVESAWLHHRFTEIHPFQDGNGRVARCLAALVLIKAGWFPLRVRRDDRGRYIDALEFADRGDLKPLIVLFSSLERAAFMEGFSIAAVVKRGDQLRSVIDAAKRDLQRRVDGQRKEWEAAKETVRHVQDFAATRFREVAQELKTELAELLPNQKFRVHSASAGDPKSRNARFQVIQTARSLERSYFANTETYQAWTSLALEGSRHAEVLIAFHGIGHDYRGVLAASACFFRKEQSEEGQSRVVVDLVPLCDEVFQINYIESIADTLRRFEPWLESVLIRGIETWRSGTL